MNDTVGKAEVLLETFRRYNAGELRVNQARAVLWALGEGLIFGEALAEMLESPGAQDAPPPVPRGGEGDG